MIYSSVPVYLDHPNWQQQPPNDHQLRNGNLNEISSFPPPPSSSTRPGSMAELARLAKIPQPEVQLKCPRCESSNTKFCYYNNYNLSQPRHFCRTCRRYWTQGGALRNVPVGGGCRRNKKNKSKSSKSSTEIPTASNLSSSSIPSGNGTREIINRFQQNPNQFPFISSLQGFSRYGVGSLGGSPNLNEIHSQSQIGGADHQWRSQQFPFLGGFESPAGPYPYQNDGVEAPSSAAEATHLQEMTLNSRATQFPPVKIEESRMLNLTRVQPSIGVLNSSQIYNAHAWTDLSGLSSSSTSHFF